MGAIVDLKKRMFALEYIRNGHNAKAAAIFVGVKESSAAQTGSQWLKDELVKAELKSLGEHYSIERLTDKDGETIRQQIADIDEILMRLTKILRREEPEENVVVLKEDESSFESGTKTTSHKEYAKIIETKTRVADVNKAADILLKHFNIMADKNGSDEKEYGIVILPEVKKGAAE